MTGSDRFYTEDLETLPYKYKSNLEPNNPPTTHECYCIYGSQKWFSQSRYSFIKKNIKQEGDVAVASLFLTKKIQTHRVLYAESVFGILW